MNVTATPKSVWPCLFVPDTPRGGLCQHFSPRVVLSSLPLISNGSHPLTATEHWWKVLRPTRLGAQSEMVVEFAPCECRHGRNAHGGPNGFRNAAFDLRISSRFEGRVSLETFS